MRRPAVTACPATLRSAVGATGFWTLAPRCVHAPACPDALARSASRGSHARARYFILAVCMGGVGGEPEADAWMNSSRVPAIYTQNSLACWPGNRTADVLMSC